MAKPRIFISSTYYDLKHVRSSLDIFIESLGHEPVLSEKGDIAYTHDIPLDESCYREASSADIFVLIIGGRYGTEVSGKAKQQSHGIFDRYDSITKKEYQSALTKDIPVYILIEANVYSEYHTYLRNKDTKDIKYAHVDSVNIFKLIEEILAQPRNNPVHTFERFADIEAWLRDQWAGLFRELLHKQSQQQQLTTLSSQVSELHAVNETLRRYLEALMKGIKPDDSNRLIESEQKRLIEIERRALIKSTSWFGYLARYELSIESFEEAMVKAESFQDFARRIGRVTGKKEVEKDILDTLQKFEDARSDFNKVRNMLGLKHFRYRRNKTESEESKGTLSEDTQEE